MTCLRKLLLASLASLTLLTPLAVTSPVQAHPTHGHHRTYYVYYRASCSDPWTCYGGYHRHSDAVRAVHWFRANGYETFIR